ncbi:MAG: clostripain-related cysteine peptidase [Syntrophobacteraceae bacterium]
MKSSAVRITMKLLMIVAVIFTIMFAGMTTSANATAQWTFMVYMVGDCDLEDQAVGDFLSMAAVGSDSNVNIVVQFDRAVGYNSEYENWTTCKRYLVTPGMTPTAANALMDLGEADMGDPNTLRDFINWAASNYPAQRYALILWDHGGGWAGRAGKLRQALPYARTKAEMNLVLKELEGLGKDTTNNIGPDYDPPNSQLRNREIKQALQAATINVNLLGFDACEMSWIETAYEMKDTGAQVMVAAQQSTYGYGYLATLTALKANPSWTPAQLGTKIVDDYLALVPDGDYAVIDLTRMGSLGYSVSNLANSLRYNWANNQNAVISAAQEVMTEISSTILYERHGVGSFHGFQIWFPKSDSEYTPMAPSYKAPEVDFPGDTTWDEFLSAFVSQMIPSWVSNARYSSQQIRPDNVDLYDFCEKLVQSPLMLWEALDFPLISWSTGGSGEFYGFTGQKSTYYVGGDAAQSVHITDSGNAWLSATVTGPGSIYFYWKVSSEVDYDWLTFSIDGVPQGHISGEVDWKLEVFSVPSGQHVLEWRYAKDASVSNGLDCGWVDGVLYTINLSQALDSPYINYTSGGTAGWIGQDRTYLVGGSSAQSRPISHFQTSWLQCTLTGPGSLYFNWKVSSQPGDVLEFRVDDEVLSSISGEVDWQSKMLTLSAGSHTVRWVYGKNEAGSAGADCGWVDQVVFIGDVGLNQALDNMDLTFATNGESSWFGQTVTHYLGGSSAQSGSLDHGQSSWLETMVVGPGVVSFYWKVSSETTFDKLRFTVDGAAPTDISGETDWQLKSIQIPGGTHLLRWTYSKDSTITKGSDCGWVDKVSYSRTGKSLDPLMLLLLD